MAVIAIRVPDNEYKYAEQLANFKGVKLSTYFRNLLAEQIEDFEDEQILKEMEEDMIINPEEYNGGKPFQEFVKEFESEKIHSNNRA